MDEARTWSKPFLVADYDTPSAYPACVQTAGGDILLVWQQDVGADAHTVAPGDNRRVTREIRACLLGLDEVEQILRG